MLAEAQRALQSMRDVASLAHHRANLINGEPCPLCGACTHPWAKRDAIDDAIVTQQGRVDQLATQQQTQQAHRNQLDAMQRVAHVESQRLIKQLDELQATIGMLTQQWSAAHVELDLLQCIATPTDPAAAAWLTDQHTHATTALQTARAQREHAELAAQAATAAMGVVLTATATASDLLKRQNQIAVQLAALSVAIANDDARRVQLDSEFATGSATLEPLLLQLQYARKLSTATAISTLHTQLAATWQRQQNVMHQATRCAAMLAGHRDACEKQLAVLAQAEAAFEAGQVADQAETQRCALDAATHGATLLAAATAHHLTFDALIALFTTSATATAELARSLAALAQSELRARELFDERERAWVEHQQTRPTLRAVLNDGSNDEASRVEHLTTQANPPTAGELAAQLTRAQLIVDDLQQHYDQRRSELAIDDANLARRQELMTQLGTAEQSATTIAALAEAIGSHDGKIFRAFAQGLTLDALLEQANYHLLGLAPRYALERVPAQDLEVQVIDRDMGDEIRGVASLSGGESFLISLALALGLSALAAHSVRVQSLFIDEGFGTLDPATLDTALAVLDALQSSGRQVGIISHVPAIAERVGATIRIVNLGAGRSRVRIDTFNDAE